MNLTQNKKVPDNSKYSNKNNTNKVQRNSDNAKKAIENWPKWKQDIAREVFANIN